MAIDPNVYALSIAIQLESADAFKTLEDFGQAAADVEDRISTAAQNTINSLSGIADQLTQGMSDAAAAAGEFTANSTELETVLSKAAEAIKKAYDTETDSLEDIEKKITFLEKIDVLLESIGISIVDENKAVEEQNKAVSAVASGTSDIKNNADASNKAFAKIVGTLGIIWGLIKKFDAETEHFVTANYRAYGSQQQLVGQTRALSAQYGILRKQAVETYKVLGNLKIPKAELDKYAKTVAEANRYTGLGIQELGNYAFRMRQVGMDADGMRKQIQFTASAMRKFGLSTTDVNTVLSDTGMSAASLDRIFKGKDQAAKYQKLKLVVAGLGKQFGHTAETANQFFTNIEDPLQRALFSSYAGQTIDTMDDMGKAVGKASVKISAELDAIKAARDAGSISIYNAQKREQNLARVRGFGSVKAMNMVADLHKAAKQMGENIETTEGYTKVLEELKRRGMDPFDEANDSMTAQLGLLKSKFEAVFGTILQLVSNALKPFVKIINAVIWVIAGAIGYIIEFNDWLTSLGFGWGYLIKALKFAIGLWIAYRVWVLASSGAMALYAAVMASSTTVMTASAAAMTTTGTTMATTAATMATAIITVLTAIGTGFGALGAAVAPVIGPLIGLGFAVMMLGVGFMLMGLGLYYAASGGWLVIPMLFMMSIAIIQFVTTLGTVAVASLAALPAIYALAVAVALLGLGAMLAGVGMYLMGISVQMIATYGVQAAGAIVALAPALLYLGLVGLFAFAGIALLGVALMLLAIPLVLIGVGMALLAMGLNMISADTIVPIAEALLLAAETFFYAGILMIPAGLFLIIGAAFIAVGAIVLIVAGLLLVPGAYLIGIAAGLLQPAGAALLEGSTALYDAAILLLPAAAMIFIGSIYLILGAVILIVAAVALGVAGAAIIIGGSVFLFGMGYLIEAAQMTYTAGMQIGVGGLMMMMGTMYIIAAAALMVLAAAAIWWVSDNFAESLAAIEPSAYKMYTIGMLLLYGGMGMLIGAILMYIAAHWLMIASIALLAASGVLTEAATWFLIAAIIVYIGSSILWTAAIWGQLAAIDLHTAAIFLQIAGHELWIASMDLYYTGKWLIPAAWSIYVGMYILELAATRFNRARGNIAKMSITMHRLAWSFNTLARAPVGALLNAASEALSAIPMLNMLGRDLDRSAIVFEKAADRFVKPVSAIAEALQDLGDAMSSINQHGMVFQKDIDKLGGMLEKYAQIMQGTAIKVETAVVAKAAPAMREAKLLGIDAAKSEAITTVQVMDKTEGDSDRINDDTLLATEQVSLLHSINEKLDGMQSGGAGELTTIVELLEAYLPTITGKDEGLSTEFNQWMK